MKYFYFFILLICSFAAQAADVTVEMLNKSGKESMVFSKKIVCFYQGILIKTYRAVLLSLHFEGVFEFVFFCDI